jgi:hypothetical protein
MVKTLHLQIFEEGYSSKIIVFLAKEKNGGWKIKHETIYQIIAGKKELLKALFGLQITSTDFRCTCFLNSGNH